MDKVDQDRWERQFALKRATQGPDFSDQNKRIRAVRAEIMKRYASAMDSYQRRSAAYYSQPQLAMRSDLGGIVPFAEGAPANPSKGWDLSL